MRPFPKNPGPGVRRRTANWSDQRNPENPLDPDETSVSVARPVAFQSLT